MTKASKHRRDALRHELRFLGRLLLAALTVGILILVPTMLAPGEDLPPEVAAEQDGPELGLLFAIGIGLFGLLVVIAVARNRSRDRRDLNRVRSEFLSGGDPRQ